MLGNERGAALLLALVVLTTMAFMAMFLGATAAMNRRMAGDDATKAKALRNAESGVAEALARVQAGLGPDPSVANAPRKVVQILLVNSGGTAGVDTTLLATGQPSGQWLPYSTASKGGNALTIEFRTDAGKTKLYRYDKTQNPPVQSNTGDPVYRVTSTGTAGNISRTIVAEVSWSPAASPYDVRGAVCAGQDVKFLGNAIACGYNHRADTPAGTGSSGRLGLGGCYENPLATPPKWEYPTGTTAGIWSTGNAAGGGVANSFGSPAGSSYNSTFYAGPWEVLGMTQSQFYTWVGTAKSSMPATPSGITYLDNDSTKQNATGSWSNNAGTGFLYCDGDLTLQSNWRGLVYVEGDLKLNGNTWILGGVICKGRSQIKFNGGATVLYSADAIQTYVAASSGNGKPKVVSWKEN